MDYNLMGRKEFQFLKITVQLQTFNNIVHFINSIVWKGREYFLQALTVLKM